MPPLRRPPPWLLIALLGLGCDPPDRMDGTVVVVVMDGVRLEESLGDEPSSATGEHPSTLMPHAWDSLVPIGARSTETWSLGATATAPAHAAMLTGRRVPFGNYPVFEDPGLYRPDLPTLMELVRRQGELGEEQVRVISNTSLIQPLEHGTWPGLGPAHGASWTLVTNPDGSGDFADDDALVVDALREALELHQPRLVVANLHKVDRAGHYGDELEYLERVQAIDEELGNLWRWLQRQRAFADDTWLLVVSDHGRHSAADTDPPWRHHGCACNGCRRVPLLLLGPGVIQGLDLAHPALLTDLAPTMGALLGVELPWASGLVLDELFEQPTGTPSRGGLAELAVAGELRAELRWLSDPAQRSELLVGGSPVSSPDAMVVEAPALAADGDRAWLCYRELTLAPALDETLWLPRCAQSEDGGWSWRDIGAPEESVGPYWRAQLLPVEDGVLAVYARNPYGLKFGGADGIDSDAEVVAARWDGEVWERTVLEGELTFPTGASAVLDGGRLVLAVAAGRSGDEGRYTRDVYLASSYLGAEEPTWSSTAPANLGALLAPEAEHWRMEQPALRLASGGLELAAVGFRDEGGTAAVLGVSEDGGATWSSAEAPDLPGQPMPHIPPVWLGDRAVFALVAEEGGEAQLCAVALGQEARCVGSGSERIAALTADGERLWAVVDAGDAWWEALELGAGELGGR